MKVEFELDGISLQLPPEETLLCGGWRLYPRFRPRVRMLCSPLLTTCDYQCLLLYRSLRRMWIILRLDRQYHPATWQQCGLSRVSSHHTLDKKLPSLVPRQPTTTSILYSTPPHQIKQEVSCWQKLIFCGYSQPLHRFNTWQVHVLIHECGGLKTLAMLSLAQHFIFCEAGHSMGALCFWELLHKGQQAYPQEILDTLKLVLRRLSWYGPPWLCHCLVSCPDPTLSRGETVWWTKSNFLG